MAFRCSNSRQWREKHKSNNPTEKKADDGGEVFWCVEETKTIDFSFSLGAFAFDMC